MSSKMKFDKEEKDILESFERGEWQSVQAFQQESQKHRKYASRTLKKDKRVNIRMSAKLLEELKAIAIENGIPYQTLMSSVLHRYVSGRLVDRSDANRQ